MGFWLHLFGKTSRFHLRPFVAILKTLFYSFSVCLVCSQIPFTCFKIHKNLCYCLAWLLTIMERRLTIKVWRTSDTKGNVSSSKICRSLKTKIIEALSVSGFNLVCFQNVLIILWASLIFIFKYWLFDFWNVKQMHKIRLITVCYKKCYK